MGLITSLSILTFRLHPVVCTISVIFHRKIDIFEVLECKVSIIFINTNFTHLFNIILLSSIDLWKQSKIIPISKTNKELGPIAILPLLSKVMENLTIPRQIKQLR